MHVVMVLYAVQKQTAEADKVDNTSIRELRQSLAKLQEQLQCKFS